MSYEKYNLFKKLENEIIKTENGFMLTYQERLFEYNNENEIVKTTNLNSLSVEYINKLIKKTKLQGEKKNYEIIYFNLCKGKLNITARNKELAEIRFKRLFNCKILSTNLKGGLLL